MTPLAFLAAEHDCKEAGIIPDVLPPSVKPQSIVQIKYPPKAAVSMGNELKCTEVSVCPLQVKISPKLATAGSYFTVAMGSFSPLPVSSRLNLM